jgi:hypothetical protein
MQEPRMSGRYETVTIQVQQDDGGLKGFKFSRAPLIAYAQKSAALFAHPDIMLIGNSDVSSQTMELFTGWLRTCYDRRPWLWKNIDSQVSVPP